jgi:hypothetical protein
METVLRRRALLAGAGPKDSNPRNTAGFNVLANANRLSDHSNSTIPNGGKSKWRENA